MLFLLTSYNWLLPSSPSIFPLSLTKKQFKVMPWALLGIVEFSLVSPMYIRGIDVNKLVCFSLVSCVLLVEFLSQELRKVEKKLFFLT